MTARKVVKVSEHVRWVDTCSSCGKEYDVSARAEDRDDGGLCRECNEKKYEAKCKSEHVYLSGAVVLDFIVRSGYRSAEVFGVVLRATDGRVFHAYAKPNYSEGETADLEIEEAKP